jgi:endonuclease YncB( thermonuclease family)
MTEPESEQAVPETSEPRRRRRRPEAILFVVVLALLGWYIYRMATWDPNRVIRVYDAQVMHIEGEQGIRLEGIAVLGSARPPDLEGPWLGEVATEFVRERVLDERVRIEQDKVKKNPEGWMLVYLFYPDDDGVEHFLNEELVRRGLALSRPQGENLRYRSRLDEAQGAAKREKVGFWDPAFKNQLDVLLDSL